MNMKNGKISLCLKLFLVLTLFIDPSLRQNQEIEDTNEGICLDENIKNLFTENDVYHNK